MGVIIRKLAVKVVEKASKVDASDAFVQLNANDVITVIKSIFF